MSTYMLSAALKININIKHTYKQDIHFVSSIDILMEKIQVRIKKVQNSLSIKNKT